MSLNSSLNQNAQQTGRYLSAALACRIGRELAENITTRMKMERVEYQVSNLIALLDRAGTSPSEKSEIICNFIKREYDLDV